MPGTWSKGEIFALQSDRGPTVASFQIGLGVLGVLKGVLNFESFSILTKDEFLFYNIFDNGCIKIHVFLGSSYES